MENGESFNIRQGSCDSLYSTTHPFIELEPGGVALRVDVLEAKEPDLAESNGLHNLVKQLLAGRVGLDRELQLRVHRRHPNIYL